MSPTILANTSAEGLPTFVPKKDHIARPSVLSDEHFHVLYLNSKETNNILKKKIKKVIIFQD